MKRRILRLLCLLCLFPLLSGCWEDAPEVDDSLSPLEPEKVESEQEDLAALPEAFALPYQPGQTLDPISCPDGMQQVVGSLLYESLFRLDERLEPQPWLCGEYTYDPDKFIYVFTLQNGVSFTDGSPLTAADVVNSLKRAKNSPRYSARLAQMRSVSARGGAVTVTLSAANSAFPALLDIPIVKSGTEKELVPIGTGPYLFSEEESGPCLLANSSWWQGGGQPIERMTLSPAESQDVMLYQFTSHEVQLITADLTGTAPVSAVGSVVSQEADTSILQYLGLNTRKEPLNDPAFRKALHLGIDRSTLVSAYLAGHGVPAQFPISPRSSLYPAEMEQSYAYDAYTAAVSAEPRTLSLVVNEENSFKVSAASYLANTLSVNGLSIQVEALPWAEYTAALSAGRFDLYYGEVKLTADWDLRSLIGSRGALNYGGWSDPETDSLLDACAASTDRNAAFQDLCVHLREQCPILPICFKSTSVLFQDGVLENLSPTAAEPFYHLSSCVIHLS